MKFSPRVVLRHLAVAGVFSATVFGLSANAQAQSKVLNIYNWSNYIGPETIANFEKETGIKVRYDNYDSNEILHAKLVAGKTGYDIVVPTTSWAKIQMDGGLLQKLDKSKIPNLKNLDPVTMKQLATLDPGNEHIVPWLGGFDTIGINVEKVKAALGGKLPDNAWDLVFKPEVVSKLRSCGVSFLDSADEIFPVALLYLGKPPYSKNPADYNQAAALLESVRKSVTLFSSSGYINDLAGGSLCVSLGWSGDINIAARRAKDSKNGNTIEALIPKIGSTLFFDTMAIPADAENLDNAYRFIDYILRPKVNAELTNTVFYANSVPESRKFIDPAIASNPTVFLSPEQLAKMTIQEAVNNDIRRLRTRLFTKFKTGL